MESQIRLDDTSLNFDHSLSKSYVSSQDIDANYNYYWEHSKSSELSCSGSILKQNEILLGRFLNNKRSKIKINSGNYNNGKEACDGVNSIKFNSRHNFVYVCDNDECKSKFNSVGGKAFSEKFAFVRNNRKKGKEPSLEAKSVKNTSREEAADKPMTLFYCTRKLSHEDFLVKNANLSINNKTKNKLFHKIYSYFNIANSESNNKPRHLNNIRNISKSFDLCNKVLITEISNGADVTRKISNVLYKIISDNAAFLERASLNEAESKNNFNKKEHNKNKNKSEFDSIDKLANLINTEKKVNNADNIIGPTPNIKEIKKNFVFNKSFDSFDVQSEFLISYLRDDDLISEGVSESNKNSESNKAEAEDENEDKDNEDDDANNGNKSNNQEAEGNENFKFNENQRYNFFKNKNFQEKVLLNINNKYSKNLQNNKSKPSKSKSKNVNLLNLDNNNNVQNKKLETGESFNNENNLNNNNNKQENQKCCFFKCTGNTHNNLNINSNYLNQKIKKGKKQDANLNSYYSTINNTKRSTNHSFKSIRLNDSLTKFRKRRLSNCTTDRDSKCPTKGSNSNLANLINASHPNKKDKKVNCRCEIF